MSVELRWIVSQSASCLHAVEALAQGLPIVDEKLRVALLQPATEFRQAIDDASLPVARFFQHLVALSAGIENNQQLAELALKKAVGPAAASSAAVQRIAGGIAVAEQAMRQTYPQLVDDLSLRAGPLREQWEARGPGFLKQAERLTDDRLLVPNADVILVHPALGGNAVAHLPYNSVRIEAVLANPEPQIPEVVRLGWSLTQLHCDLPAFSESIAANRLPLLAQLALLPVALAAGEYVELTRCDLATIELALAVWRIPKLTDVKLAEVILDWWGTYQETKPRWDVALGALDRMVDAIEVRKAD